MHIQRLTTSAGALALAALLLAPLPAAAQFGGLPKVPKVPSASSGPSDAQRKRINEINSLAQKGVGKLPGSWRENAEKKAKALADAEGYLEQCRALVGPDLRAMSSAEGALRYYDELAAGVERGRYEVRCLAAYEPLAKRVDAGEPVEDAALAQLDAAVKAYADAKLADSQADWWAQTAARLREKSASVAGKKQAAAERAAASDLRDAQNDALDDLHEALAAMLTLAQKGEPIPDDMLAAYEAGVVKVEAFNPMARTYFDTEKKPFLLWNAWLRGAEGEADIAVLYGAAVAARGESKGKAMKLAFKAEADHCYLVVGRFADEAGASTSLEWKKRDITSMQRFRLRDAEGWPFDVEGFCATKAFPVERAGTLEFTGTRNVYRIVVLDWERGKLPVEIGGLAAMTDQDPCDPTAYYERWANPVPGTVSYKGEVPVGGAGIDIVLESRARGYAVANEHAYSGKPPAKVKFPRVDRGTCWDAEDTGDKDAKAYATCNAKISKQYGPKYDAAQRRKASARTIGALRAAEAELSRLSSAEDTARERQCRPIWERIDKRLGQENDRLADLYADHPHQDHIDTVKWLIDRAEATKRPLLLDGRPEGQSDGDARRSRRARILKERARE